MKQTITRIAQINLHHYTSQPRATQSVATALQEEADLNKAGDGNVTAHISGTPNDGCFRPGQVDTSCTSMAENSPRLELIDKMRKMEWDAMSQCRETLNMMQRVMRRQKTTNIDVMNGVSRMIELLDVMLSYRRTWKAAEERRTTSIIRKKIATQ